MRAHADNGARDSGQHGQSAYVADAAQSGQVGPLRVGCHAERDAEPEPADDRGISPRPQYQRRQRLARQEHRQATQKRQDQRDPEEGAAGGLDGGGIAAAIGFRDLPSADGADPKRRDRCRGLHQAHVKADETDADRAEEHRHDLYANKPDENIRGRRRPYDR
jgi:hypothetical protein